MNKVLTWSYENKKGITMIYQSNNGNITQRVITIMEVKEHSIKAYCHLRKCTRLFKLENILSVAVPQQMKGA